jgi:hypothetical protein
VPRRDDLLAALMGAQAGGFLAQPPGLDGEQRLGIAGISGVPRGRTWDAVGSASCPGLPGDEVTFVTLDDGTIVVDADVPDDSLVPLADAIEATLRPPYRVAAIRSEGEIWTAVAESVRIVELPGVGADVVEFTSIGGEQTLKLDGEPSADGIAPLAEIAGEAGDVVISAERVDGDVFAADIFPL